MPTVILARHGRSTANASGVLAGRAGGIGLDGTGRAQARTAAERIADLPLALAVSSPMRRCRETTRLLLADRDVPVAVDPGLQECDYGEWTGRPLKELAKEPLWRTVQVQPSLARFPGGESLPEMSARAILAVRDRDAWVAAEHGENAVWLAVAHGDIIKAVLADALGSHLDGFQRIMVDPGSLSVIRYTAQRPFVVTMNSVAGSLAGLRAHAVGRRRARRSDDAVPGGGAGPSA